MPIGKYPNFEACVADNQDKDDPEAYCGALEQATQKSEQRGAIGRVLEGLAKLFTPDTDVIAGLKSIDDGLKKAAAEELGPKIRLKGAIDGKIRLRRRVPIVKVDEEQRLVYGVVYEPDVEDAHGDSMSKAEIEKAAHGFMQRYSLALAEPGTDHTADVSRDQVTVVENYIAPADFKLGQQTIKAGTWMMVAKVHDEPLWQDVKGGRYTGWSFEGYGERVAA